MLSQAEKRKRFILWFDEITIKDIPFVGGKNASLGEMYRELTGKGVKIPNGFAITAYAYQYLLKAAGIKDDIREILKGLDVNNLNNLYERGRRVRETILRAEFPLQLREEIIVAYHKLSQNYRVRNVDTAVRSSATAEDLPDASFAGQQETYLNVSGDHALIEACKACFASLFTNRAISYREAKKFDHFSISLSIAVQKMVRSDLAASGVMFSIDTESGFKDAVMINASYGLGENIVQGAVTPDEYYVHKPTLALGYKPIIGKKIGSKEIKMVYSFGTTKPVKNIRVPLPERQKYALADPEILKLAKWGVIIEEHYSQRAGKFKPMDMEWAKDGETQELFIVQARPETVTSQRNPNVLQTYVLLKRGRVLTEGGSIGSKIGTGSVHVIEDVKDIGKFKAGEVLVTEMTDPDWEPIMKKAAAIVTNAGGRTCHAAIISRELGVPCIVGTGTGTADLKNAGQVTVSCAEGDKGFVYAGKLPFTIKKTDLKTLKRPKTKVMMNVGNPESAFADSFIPNDGVGLAREEFVINDYIKIHPMALLNFKKLKDSKVISEIQNLTASYANKAQFFVDKLAEGVARIAAAFYPKDVIVRLSDFKTNEYANLIGGKEFEPIEDNPMIGWRGASRYYDPKYEPAFKLECLALRKVRDVMGLKNLKVMVPFCRTVKEGQLVIETMKKYGLVQHKDGLEVYVMCEIPANVILVKEFSKIFDGFSIGSNDLTQLTLGVDRDSALVAHVYDERNAAVKNFIRQVIRGAKEAKRKIGICGQAPSDFPDFAQFLAQEGIDSISLNPDTVIKTTVAIYQAEQKARKKK
ncbi:phosphoenolpyruvate synthase [Candidatus Parcubacteria bacterium]|nr:MAG: phosphoenolpyruvate synthase [Candidatus Parcubacteria bacterium]